MALRISPTFRALAAAILLVAYIPKGGFVSGVFMDAERRRVDVVETAEAIVSIVFVFPVLDMWRSIGSVSCSEKGLTSCDGLVLRGDSFGEDACGAEDVGGLEAGPEGDSSAIATNGRETALSQALDIKSHEVSCAKNIVFTPRLANSRNAPHSLACSPQTRSWTPIGSVVTRRHRFNALLPIAQACEVYLER